MESSTCTEILCNALSLKDLNAHNKLLRLVLLLHVVFTQITKHFTIALNAIVSKYNLSFLTVVWIILLACVFRLFLDKASTRKRSYHRCYWKSRKWKKCNGKQHSWKTNFHNKCRGNVCIVTISVWDQNG